MHSLTTLGRCIYCGHLLDQHARENERCMKNPHAELFDRILLPTSYKGGRKRKTKRIASEK